MNRSSLPSFLHIPRTFVGMSALAEQRSVLQVTDVGIREAVRAQSPALARRPRPAPPKRCKDGEAPWQSIVARDQLVSRRVIDLRVEEARTACNNNKT